jgi:hypothetical protein
MFLAIIKKSYEIPSTVMEYLKKNPVLIKKIGLSEKKHLSLIKFIIGNSSMYNPTGVVYDLQTRLEMLKTIDISKYNRLVDILSDSKCEESEKNSVCTICIDNAADILLGCNHRYCSQCLYRLETQRCPTCRAPITSRRSVVTEQVGLSKVTFAMVLKELTSKFKPKNVLRLISRTALLDLRFNILLNSSGRLKPDDLIELELFETELTDDELNKLRDLLKSKQNVSNQTVSEEILTAICKILYNREIFSPSDLVEYISNPNRLIRFFGYMHSGLINMDPHNVQFKKLKKPDIRLIMDLLNSMDIKTVLDMIKQNISWWKNLFKHIHIGALLKDRLHKDKLQLKLIVDAVRDNKVKDTGEYNLFIEQNELQLNANGSITISTIDGKLNAAFDKDVSIDWRDN